MKTAGKIALGIFAGVVTISAGSYLLARKQVFNQSAKLTSVQDKVSVISPCWYETNSTMAATLQSLHNQNIVLARPSQFEFITVGCTEVDMKLAAQYSDKTACVNGKLNARVEGIRMASGSIIVSVDCDTYYPVNWLNMVLAPFENPKVVAVQSVTDHGMPLSEAVFQLPIQGFYSMRLSGRGSAFRKQAFYDSGGWNLNIDQKNMDQMVLEEELNFKRKMQRLGIVSTVNAPNYHLVTGAKTGGLHVKA